MTSTGKQRRHMITVDMCMFFSSLGKIGHDDDDNVQEPDLEKSGLFSDKKNFKLV